MENEIETGFTKKAKKDFDNILEPAKDFIKDIGKKTDKALRGD